MLVMSGKTAAAFEWAKSCPVLNDFLKLNAIEIDEGDASFSPVPSSSDPVKNYVDGTAEYKYIFMLKMALPWSDGFDSVNKDASTLVEAWHDWVNLQYPANVPEFGCEVTGIEAVEMVPSVMVYQEESTAAYSFQAAITFVE